MKNGIEMLEFAVKSDAPRITNNPAGNGNFNRYAVSLALDYPLDEAIKKPVAAITTTGF